MDDLATMVARAFPQKALVAAVPLYGGFANSNYKARVFGMEEPVVVRVYAREAGAAGREVSALRRVHGRVPVPEVLHVNEANDEEPACTILSWVEGIPLERLLRELRTDQAMGAARATGRVLADLHSIAGSAPGYIGPTPPEAPIHPTRADSLLSFVEDSLLRCGGRQRLGPDLSDRLWRFIVDNVSSLRTVEHDAALVHGDFNPFNILATVVDGEARISAVLDWEYAHWGTPLLDVGSMLRSCRARFPWFEGEFVAGYLEHGGELPAQWRMLSTVLDLVRLCGFLRCRRAGTLPLRNVRAVIESSISDRAA